MRISLFLGLTRGGKVTPTPGPTNTVAPAVSGTTEVGQTLTSTTGTWTGTGTITYAYQWHRNGVAIGGATSSTYTLVSADGGNSVFCQVTATDDNGSRAASSNVVSVAEEPAADGAFSSAFSSAFSVAA